MRRTGALLLGCCLALGACGGDEDGDSLSVRACSPEVPVSENWRGRLEPDRATGEADVSQANDFLEEAPVPISTSPCDAARVLLRVDRPPGEGGEVNVAVTPEDAIDATVTVTFDRLADDSIRSQRWTLAFEEDDGGAMRLASARVAYRCQPGRGHQEFSAELCV